MSNSATQPAAIRQPRSASVQGFTLVEMLVALALLGLAAGYLMSGLAATSRFVARSDGTSQDEREMETARRLLTTIITRLSPQTRTDSADPLVDTRGNSDDFSFYGPPLDYAAPAALRRYRILRAASGDLLLLQADSLDPSVSLDTRVMNGWSPMTLLSGTAALTIDYFGEDPVAAGSRWQTSWFARRQPPALVRVRVAFPPGDRRHWPDLVLRPRATVSTACRIDAVTGDCEQLQ